MGPRGCRDRKERSRPSVDGRKLIHLRAAGIEDVDVDVRKEIKWA